MAKVLVEVTKDDIANGLGGDPSRCPVSLAITRALKLQQGQVSVGPEVYRVWTGNRPPRFGLIRSATSLPARVVAFIHEVDSRNVVQPISFEIDDLTAEEKASV